MTAKQWEIIDEEFISYTGGTAQLISNGECEIHLWETPKDAQLFCDKLNAINEENEQLKQANERICDDIDLALGFIQHKGYSLQDIKDYEDAKKEYEEDLKEFRKGDVE